MRAIVAAAAVRRSGARRRDATTHRRRRGRPRAPSRRERGRPRNADASDSSEISSFDASSSAAVLKEALAELYLADGQRERALALHLELGRPGVLDFIARHGLLAAAKDRIPRLAAMDRPARRRFSSINAAPSRRTSSPRNSRTPPRRASEARARSAPVPPRALRRGSVRGRGVARRADAALRRIPPGGIARFPPTRDGIRSERRARGVPGRGTRTRTRLPPRSRRRRATALRVLVEDLRDVPGAVAFAQAHAAGDPDDPDDPGDDELWDELIALVTTRTDLGDARSGNSWTPRGDWWIPRGCSRRRPRDGARTGCARGWRGYWRRARRGREREAREDGEQG